MIFILPKFIAELESKPSNMKDVKFEVVNLGLQIFHIKATCHKEGRREIH